MKRTNIEKQNNFLWQTFQFLYPQFIIQNNSKQTCDLSNYNKYTMVYKILPPPGGGKNQRPRGGEGKETKKEKKRGKKKGGKIKGNGEEENKGKGEG